MKKEHSVRQMCAAFEVERSGYLTWCKAPASQREQTDALLSEQIQVVHEKHKGRYGAPRIQDELAEQGSRHGVKRIARLMKSAGIQGLSPKRFVPQTTDSNHDHPIAPNRLAEAPATTAPDQIWVADITYIQTQQGWLYLAAVLDLYSRKVVGWAMSESIDTTLVLGALSMALLHRNPPPNLLFHSDRGVQYASGDFRTALAQANLIPSMSRKGNCYDNATMESFWSSLKLELIYRRNFTTHNQARSEIFDYIECFYNSRRSHSSINFQSPVDFELQNN